MEKNTGEKENKKTQNKKKIYHSRKVIFIIIALGVAFATVAISIFYLFGQKIKKDYTLFIYPNSSYETVVNELTSEKVITNKPAFEIIAKVLKYPDLVKPGRYVLKRGMTYFETVRKLRSGAQTPIKLTIPSKRNLNELLQYISNKFAFSYDSLRKEIDNKEFYDSTEFNEYTIIALFIPNTYEFYWTTPPDKFLRKMYKHYKNFWKQNARSEKAKQIGFSPLEIITIASIVQEETNVKSEYSKIAGVYINRLKKDMKLQADPTVRFALKDFGLKRVLLKHLKLDSPYNTYKYKGLPPGPINNPYPQVIDAVLNYDKHNYLFFCASPKLNGTHLFAKNYAQHKKNAQKYQNTLNKLRIWK